MLSCMKLNKDAVIEVGIENLPPCPLEDVDHPDPFASTEECPFHKTVHIKTEPDGSEVTDKGKSTFSKHSAQILKDIGGGDRIRQMMTRFYAHAFKDETLSKFMFDTDGAAAHGQRLADWFIQEMGGEGTPWKDSGRGIFQRQRSHRKAWNSDKRPRSDRGTSFQQDDCRIWMRLNFLAGRQVGLDKFETFWEWYVDALYQLIGVYEPTAPPFARESMEWSENQANFEKYKLDGHKMSEVIGVGRRK